MIRAVAAKMARLLRRPLFGTRVIPEDAAVDPELFPEDAYPVYCPKCNYWLRGLPDGQCPECGTSFERGKLLVRSYATGWSGVLWRRSKARAWYNRFLITGFAIQVVGLLAIFALLSAFTANPAASATTATIDWGSRAIYALGTITMLSPLCFAIAAGIAIAAYPRGSWERRRAILEAIDRAISVDSANEGALHGERPDQNLDEERHIP